MKKSVKVTLIVLPIGILGACFIAAVDAARMHAHTAQCNVNLRQISLGVLQYQTDHHDSYPPSFQAITNYCAKPELFVCPATGHKVGSLTNIEQWSDYVLLPGAWTASRMAKGVTAFCIPEHHRRKCGLIVFNDGSLEIVAPKDFWTTVIRGQEK